MIAAAYWCVCFLLTRCRLRLCARELVNLLDEPLVPFIMLQSLPMLPSNLLPPLSSDDGLGVAAAALAAAMPRAVTNAHVASEINSAVRPLGLTNPGRDIVGNMLMAFELQQLTAVDDVQPPGFPDAVDSLEVTFVCA